MPKLIVILISQSNCIKQETVQAQNLLLRESSNYFPLEPIGDLSIQKPSGYQLYAVTRFFGLPKVANISQTAIQEINLPRSLQPLYLIISPRLH